jgi:hypothetical protein
MITMNKSLIFGHKHFGLFYKRILEVSDRGFKYRRQNYLWKDIKRVSRHETFLHTLFFYQYGYPLSIIYLNNGKKIYLQGRILHEEGKRIEFNFWYPTQSYNNLLSFIEAKVKGSV